MNPNDQNQAALQFVDTAFEIGNSIDGSGRDEIMMAVAVNYAAQGLPDDALRTAEEISDSHVRDTAITRVAVSTIGCDPEADVLSFLDAIDDPGLYNVALEQISIKYAESGLIEEALDVSARLDNRDSALSRIVTIIGEKESLEQAEQLVEEISDGSARAMSLVDLATVAKEADQAAEAGDLLGKAEAEAESEELPIERVYHLIAIAEVYETLAQRDKANQTLSMALRRCDEIESFNTEWGKSFTKDEALVAIAGRFARYENDAQAGAVLEQIENPFEYARALTQQAIEYHKHSQSERSLQSLTQARDLLSSQECYGNDVLLLEISLGELAVAYATAGHYKEALEAALLITDLQRQFATLTELGRQAARANLSDSIFEIYDVLSGDYPRASYLVDVSDSLRESGNQELSTRLVTKAIEDADKIQRTDEKCLMLLKISARLRLSDLEAKADEIVMTVLETAAGLRDGYQRARVVLALAEHYQRHPKELNAAGKEMLERMVD